MRIAVFSSDIPYPANRGGRADVWRRILAFRRLGHEVMLVNLFEPTGAMAPTAEHLNAVDDVVSARFSFPIKRGAWRTLMQLATAWHTPWHAATRMPTPAEQAELLRRARTFRPDLLWLEGPWFGRLVLDLARALDCEFAYRSHNIEHQYLWRQASVAMRLRDRLAWRLACIGVRAFERQLMNHAAAVFDISTDDMHFWQQQGVQRLHWLPPLPELAIEGRPQKVVAGDIVFVGNLGTPNNVRGVEFLLKQVLPLVRQRHPHVRCAIVGSNPTQHVRSWVEQSQGVDLYANVAQPMQHLFGARVLVNPVMTGSGVQLKMLDMLMTDAPIVTCPQGTRGLPDSIAGLVAVATTPREFSTAVCSALAGSAPCDLQARRHARRMFSADAVDTALVQVAFAANTP